MKIIIVMMMVFCLSLPTWGTEAHNDLPGLPASMLLAEGQRCVNTDSLEERGEAAFNVIVNRYHRNPNDTALRRAATIALRHLGNLYLSHDIDYVKSYRSLQLARQIASDDGDSYQLAFILKSLAALYSANVGNNDTIASTTQQLLLDALRNALESNNKPVIIATGINAALTNLSEGDWGIFKNDIHKITSIPFEGPDSLEGHVMKLLVTATDSFFANEYEASERLLQKARQSMSTKQYSERLLYTCDIMLIKLYLHTAQFDKAIAIMRRDMENARTFNHKDYEFYMIHQLALCYDEIGQTDSAEKYYTQYLKMNDALSEKQRYGKIESLDFLSKIEQSNKELENLSIRHQKARRNLIVIISVLIIVFIILMALIFVHTNLRRANRNLFMRNEEALRREKQHKIMRDEWERKTMALEQKISQLSASIDDSKHSEDDDDTGGRSSTDIFIDDGNRKDESSTEDMNPDRLTKLYARILKVMEENPSIFQAGFSLSDLAEILSSTPRSVSRAINVCHNSNFHQLLNEYRIREVTRLMHEPEFANHTIEAIAERAGFKSRTSFSRLFKSMIGITPSEYVAMAKKELKTNDLSNREDWSVSV